MKRSIAGTLRRIRRFIGDSLLEEPYDGDDPLADEVLDSLAIEQLVAFLEESYGITFTDEEMVAENFSSLATLASLVDHKRRSLKGQVSDAAST